MIFRLALLGLLALASASDVLEFTDSDFDSRIGGYDVILVEFFAPWCGHCKKLAPEYEIAATKLKSNDPPVALAKVDCTANTEVCSKHGVSGYPTLKIFRDGVVSEDYNGPREADGIVKTMKKKAGPASKTLENLSDAEKFIGSTLDYGVVGFFSSENDDAAKTFQKVAASVNDMRFAHTYVKDVAEKYGYSDAIVMFQPKKLHSKFEDKEQKYDGDVSLKKVKDWISENSLGLCGERTMDNADKFSKPLVVAYFDVDYIKNVKGTNYWRNRVMKVGQKVQGEGKKVSFAISNSVEFSRELDEFGLTASGDKPVVTGRNARDQKFVMADEFSMDNLEKFVNDLLDGNLEAYMKSEPVPEQNEAVKVLVAKNFDDIITDDKDALIEFYAPWCGHCKQLEPKYTELAEKLADESELVIAKMDATANDVPPQFEVQGFPTIYFKAKGAPPKKYQGGREVDDFVKYLAKESTNELAGYKRDGKKKKSAKKQEL